MTSPTPAARSLHDHINRVNKKLIAETSFIPPRSPLMTKTSKRLRGAIAFDINELTRIASVLNVPLDTLLSGVAA